MADRHIWLRAEVKPGERRSPLTPEGAKLLLDKGFQVTVERSKHRIYKDEEYERQGCSLTSSSWHEHAPTSALILGLKELDDDLTFPLKHKHVFFAHCYKGQRGAAEVLRRFKEGGGQLRDLEYLVSPTSGVRLATFSFTAGLVGCGLGLWAWASNGTLPSLDPWDTPSAFYHHLKQVVTQHKGTEKPRVMIIGALGRAGRGAQQLLRSTIFPDEEEYRAKVLLWDYQETAAGGPFPQILDYDILVNCVLVTKPMPPFLTRELLQSTPEKKLSVVVDVSCDVSSSLNPLPFLTRCTTLTEPIMKPENSVSAIVIDHLPTLLPLSASESFATELLPHLVHLFDEEEACWARSKLLFDEHLAKIQSSL